MKQNLCQYNKLFIIFFLFCTSLKGMPNIIESLTINNNVVHVTANKEFSQKYLKESFFAEYDKNFNLNELDYSILTIPFIMNVIPIIWISNQNYAIESMDKDLYNSLKIIKKVYRVFHPSVSWSGNLIPKKLVNNRLQIKKENTGVLFSHGLDAVHTSLKNRNKPQTLITIGGGDIKVNNIAMWEKVKKECRHFARTYHHTPTSVRANFNAFKNLSYLNSITPEVTNWFSHTQALTYIGLALPIAYKCGCPELLIASTYTIDKPFPDGTHPAIDNNLHICGIQITHDSPDRTRIEKTQDIIRMSKEQLGKKPFLRVCWGHDQNGRNCGQCEKCLRTIVGILAEGEAPHDYGFELTIEQAIKNAYQHLPTKKVLKPTKLWYWKCIQERAQKALAAHQSLCINNANIRPFLTWIATFNFDSYNKNSPYVYSEESKKMFEDLWQKGVNRTLTEHYLDTLLLKTSLNPGYRAFIKK